MHISNYDKSVTFLYPMKQFGFSHINIKLLLIIFNYYFLIIDYIFLQHKQRTELEVYQLYVHPVVAVLELFSTLALKRDSSSYEAATRLIVCGSDVPLPHNTTYNLRRARS
jgi:hypothetical protein